MKEDIIRMAREAGFELDCCSLEWHGRIERFFHMAQAAEREACARICEDRAENADLSNHRRVDADRLARAIRARGQA